MVAATHGLLLVLILEISHTIAGLVRQACSDKAKFSFLSDVLMITLIVWDRVDSLFSQHRIVSFAKYMT